uniref:Thioredoxin n=1 Tax=candidate division WOR-3 bacterium TaxID=2052148 RepID=A0A7C6A8Y1_UNCW3
MSIELTQKNFKTEILDAPVLSIVDFWAPWCMPCRMIAPVLEEIAKDYADKIKVGKVNVDNETALAAEYSIMSIPALLFFKDGKVVDQIIGAVPKEHIEEKLKSLGVEK